MTAQTEQPDDMNIIGQEIIIAGNACIIKEKLEQCEMQLFCSGGVTVQIKLKHN